MGIATSTIKSNYFRFATITLNFMRNELLHIVGIHNMGFIMCRTYKIDLYTVLISTVDGETLLVLVRVRHFENAGTLFLHYDIVLCGE